MQMEKYTSEFLCFVIDEQYYALPLESIDVVIRAQTITELENKAPFFHGIIDLHGVIVPIISLRKRFSLEEINVKLTDRFIIINSENRRVGIIVDEVANIITVAPEEILESSEIYSGLRYLKIINRENGIVFIYDLNSLLDKNEEVELQKILDSYQKKRI